MKIQKRFLILSAIVISSSCLIAEVTTPSAMMETSAPGEEMIDDFLGITPEGINLVDARNRIETISASGSSVGAVPMRSSRIVAPLPSVVVHDEVASGGLSNNRADCFINSSLQLCKAFKGQLDQSELARMPYLAKFLNEGLQSDEECRLLRQEMATEVIKGDQDLQGVFQEGTAQTHQDAAAFLRLLLKETKVPQIFFEETLQCQTTGSFGTSHPMASEQMLQLALPADNGTSMTMQNLVNDNLVSARQQRWVDEELSSPVVNVTSSLKLREPISSTLVVLLGRFGYDGSGIKNQRTISGLKEHIALPTADGRVILYEPTGMICHFGNSLEEGHYVCYLKKNGGWLLFNDNHDVAVPVALEDSFPHKNSCVISYTKIDSNNEDQGSAIIREAEKTNEVDSENNQKFAASIVPLTRERKQLPWKGWEFFLRHSLSSAEESLKNLHLEIAAATYRKNQQVIEAWRQILPTAERLVQYIKNCRIDHNHHQLSPQGLAAMDRVEEALRLKIKSARFFYQVSVTLSDAIAGDALENQAKYMINALLAERVKNQFLSERWSEAARESSVEIQEKIKNSRDENSSIQLANDQLIKARNYTAQAKTALADGNEQISYHWNQAAEQARIVSVTCILKAQAEAEKNRSYKKCSHLSVFQYTANELFEQLAKIAEYHAKAFQARSSGQQELAHLWTWAASGLQINIEKKKESNLLRTITNRSAQLVQTAQQTVDLLAKVADYSHQARKALEVENQIGADLWNQAAKQMQLASEYAVQIGLRKIAQDSANISSLEKEVLLVKGIAEELCKLAKQSTDTVFTSNQEAKIAKCNAQIEQARAAGNSELADLWTTIGNKLQAFLERAADTTDKNQRGVQRLEYSAMLNEAAARESARLAKSTNQPRIVVQKKCKIITAYNTGNWQEAERLERAALLTQLALNNSVKSAVSTEFTDVIFVKSPLWIEPAVVPSVSDFAARAAAARAVGDQEKATLWDDVAKQVQILYEKEIQSVAANDWNNWNQRDEDIKFAKAAVRRAKARAIGNQELLELFIEMEEMTRIFYEKANEVSDERSMEVGNHDTLRRAPLANHYIDEALEAFILGNEQQASLWIQAAKQMKLAVEEELEAFQLKLVNDKVKKKDQVPSLLSIARRVILDQHENLVPFAEGMTLAADYVANADKARELKNQKLDDLWTQAASQQKLATENRVKGASISDITESKRWQDIARTAQTAADNFMRSAQAITDRLNLVTHYTAQATKNKIAGKQKVADAYFRAVQQLEQATLQEAQAAKAEECGDRIAAAQLREAASIANGRSKKEADAASSFFTEAENYAKNAVAARASGNQELFELWAQSARQMELAGEESLLIQPEQPTFRFRWNSAVNVAYHAAEKLAKAARYATKAIECKAAGNQEEAYLWSQAAKQLGIIEPHSSINLSEPFITAINYKAKAARALTLQKETIANQWAQAAVQMRLSGESNVYAASARMSRDVTLGFLWSQAGTAAEAAAQNRAQVAQCYEVGDDSVHNENILASQNQIKAERFINAAKSQIAGNQVASDLWAQAANQKEFSNQGKKQCSDYSYSFQNSLDDVASSFINSIGDALAQEARARDHGQQRKVQHLNKEAHSTADIVDIFVKAIEYDEKAATCRNLRKKEEADLWSKAASASRNDSKNRAANLDHDKMESKGNGTNENPSQKAAERYVHAAESFAAGHIEIANLLAQAANVDQKASDQFMKAAEALSSGNEKLADLWRKAAEQAQGAQNKEASTHSTTSNNNPNDQRRDAFLKEVQLLAQEASERFIKAAEALSSGNEELADLWRKAAEQTQIASETQRDRAAAVNDNRKSQQLKKAAKLAKEEAARLAKIAQAAGDQPTKVSKALIKKKGKK